MQGKAGGLAAAVAAAAVVSATAARAFSENDRSNTGVAAGRGDAKDTSLAFSFVSGDFFTSNIVEYLKHYDIF